jgi:hypothetical protein
MEQKTSKNVPMTRPGSLRDEALKHHISHTTMRRHRLNGACLYELERQLGKALFEKFMLSGIHIGSEQLWQWAVMAHENPELGQRICAELLKHHWELGYRMKENNDFIRFTYTVYTQNRSGTQA